MSDEDEQPVHRPAATGAEAATADNSLGRLLTLCDGIFAIAMTLLALDLKVPDLGDSPGDKALRHALAANADSYWAYLLTFYVIASYWMRHRRLLRSVVTTHPALIRDTLMLLVTIAAMPFPASLLGRYGGEPIALALYGAVNALATLSLMLSSYDVRRLQLSVGPLSAEDDYIRHWWNWLHLVVFLLCIPAGYVLGSHGPWVLVLLALPNRWEFVSKVRRRRRLQADRLG
jgi:uncharacterized membrane protein